MREVLVEVVDERVVNGGGRRERGDAGSVVWHGNGKPLWVQGLAGWVDFRAFQLQMCACIEITKVATRSARFEASKKCRDVRNRKGYRIIGFLQKPHALSHLRTQYEETIVEWANRHLLCEVDSDKLSIASTALEPVNAS